MVTEHTELAKEARLRVLDLIFKAQSSHIGSNFSVIDILAVLFDKADPLKDEVILSAGWKAASWYFFLWKKGIITEEELNSYCQPNSPFIGLVEPLNRWGLRCAGGSMGFGLPFAVGMAISKKMKGETGKVYCVMSDGELQSGTTWESLLIAKQRNLNNLIVIVDNNTLQAMGKTKEILSTDPLMERIISFGWRVLETDGHDFEGIEDIWNVDWENSWSTDGITSKESDNVKNTPLFMICNTVKGKGVSFMENNNLYHYKNLSDAEYESAKKELND